MTRPVHGLRAWALQRLSAVYLFAFVIYLLTHFAISPPADYAAWRAWVAQPAVGVAFALCFMMLLVHAWVGMRDVLMDYARPVGLRAVLLVAVGFGLLLCGVWAARILVLAAVT
jgi:succinate dehydrogenase / fumarate reductase membrane anchor subunit